MPDNIHHLCVAQQLSLDIRCWTKIEYVVKTHTGHGIKETIATLLTFITAYHLGGQLLGSPVIYGRALNLMVFTVTTYSAGAQS